MWSVCQCRRRRARASPLHSKTLLLQRALMLWGEFQHNAARACAAAAVGALVACSGAHAGMRVLHIRETHDASLQGNTECKVCVACFVQMQMIRARPSLAQCSQHVWCCVRIRWLAGHRGPCLLIAGLPAVSRGGFGPSMQPACYCRGSIAGRAANIVISFTHR